MATLRARLSGQAGLTLVELLVTMTLLGVVGTLVTAAVVNASQGLVHVEDENKGLQDAKVILDRMSRDARHARSIVCRTDAADPNCEKHLELWVDKNSDYVPSDDEIVTWQLEPDPDGNHFDVYRVVGTGASATRQRQASTLIVETLFRYETGKTVEQSQLVKMTLTYDAMVGLGTQERQAHFTARLRNKGIR
ncbi:MAG TPA: type II secretion system protein [Nocardioidaceae bacterium]|nr:type II secretion system protein [Nocardioidaceae bacterium]